MYPIYPLLCLMSALALVNIEDGLCFMISGLTAFEKKKKAETEKNGMRGAMPLRMSISCQYFICCVV